MAVHPKNQRKGIATALVQSSMVEAQKLGLNIFILAFEAGVELYKRLGFRTEKKLVQNDSAIEGKGEYSISFIIYDQRP